MPRTAQRAVAALALTGAAMAACTTAHAESLNGGVIDRVKVGVDGKLGQQVLDEAVHAVGLVHSTTSIKPSGPGGR
ncbi:hypothetical protein ACGF5F_27775 [Streptomyces sp. NPDC047821]|uniref:hypothetical protein n=1 Tax=unclassified Streptomyces TaxID=2593676 RepID=UPI0036329795